MAISTSSDCSSLPSIHSSRNPHNFNFPLTRRILSFPHSKSPFFPLAASNCPPPILEEPSVASPAVILDLELEDSRECELPNVNNLNFFLRSILKDNRTVELAYEYYNKAKEREQFKPERSTLKLLLRYLIRTEKWDLISEVSDDFKKYHVFPDKYTCTLMITCCVKARKIRIAESLLQVFESDFELAVLGFESAMRGYNKLHMYSSTVTLYDRMKISGIGLNSGCYCHIMKAYFKTGDTERVITLFHEFRSRKLDATQVVLGQIYRILCDSLGKSGRAFEALEYFRDMKKKGISEDPAIYSSLICSFANIGESGVAEELFKEAEERKLLRDTEVFLKLVLMYTDQGQLDKILGVVKAIKRSELRMCDCIFSAIINGYSKRRGYHSAIRIFEELKSEGFEPGKVTYASVINTYCRIGLYSHAEAVFLEMEKKGFDRCVVTYSTVIAMYGKAGRLKDAMRLVAKMKLKGCQPNVWIYNSLMDMHGKVKNTKQVEKIWKEMKRRKVAPDKVSYTAVICAYNKAKEFDLCIEYYNEYRMNGGKIDRAMAGIMVGVFSKTSQIDKLLKLLQDMKSEGVELDSRLYLSALNALRDSGMQVQAQLLEEKFAGT